MTAKRRRKLRERFYLSQKGKCKLCGGRMPPLDIAPEALHNPDQYASLDHIIPLSKGGSSKVTNLQLTHMRCNGEKGDTIEVVKKA